ncbi:MAG TPA: hypothetical protein DEV59_11490 [Proteus sp.]|uniref:hypothetical protein n=1 Tax=Proteus hauseri TaxID=183417 RepID=UPI000EE737B4|nr:hypothetical protein [Proteus hauseri]QAV24587.1 hypothetical protein PH4a_15090 [Proteus hauseri]HCH51293.1 hypothetical protein [Proteus sp. (in: enterobacteria)]
MKFFKIFTVILAVLILSGCVAGPGWYKEGVPYDDSQNTLAKCKFDIGIAKVNSNEKTELIAECMKSQGYRYKNYSHSY